MKYTTQSYIEKAQIKYPNRFDYSPTNYLGSHKKIEVICKEHNLQFQVDPITFIRESSKGDFCKECSHNRKLSHDEYMLKIKKYERIYDLSKVKFTTTRNEVELICKEHGSFNIEARFLSQSGIYEQCKECKGDISTSAFELIQKSPSAVFYKILVTHTVTKLQWIKIGITCKSTKERYSKGYKDFNIEVLEETFDSGEVVIELEREYKRNNKHKRFYIPNDIKFVGKTECYILDEEYQLKASQVKFIRDGLLDAQNGICPICEKDVDMPVLEHNHSKKHNGTGLVRGVVCNTCNRFLGVIENNLTKNRIEFSEARFMLTNIGKYIDEASYPLLHPSEVIKEPNIKKSLYNKLKKVYLLENRKKKFPDFPKSSKMTKDLKALSEEFSIPLV